MCAVVKGDGYGHGMVPAARAAQAGGAAGSPWRPRRRRAGCAARASRAGAGDGRALAEELEVALAARARTSWRWREAFVGRRCPPARGVHVKLDSGMGRLGHARPGEATRVAARGRRRHGCAAAR
jgi:alanine racemase